MKSFAQDIATHCGDMVMVTFNTFTEIPWYEVFEVDHNIKMFVMMMLLANALSPGESCPIANSRVCDEVTFALRKWTLNLN